LYDINGDGKLTLPEVEEITKAVYALLGYYVAPTYDHRTSDDHARKFFAKLDPEGRGFVLKDDFVQHCSEVRNDRYYLK
jgi:Ca2+-binding EF-hand superfamily protein